jgi:hypothetical protein
VQNVIGVFVYGYYAGAVTGVSQGLVTSARFEPGLGYPGDFPYTNAPGLLVHMKAAQTGYPIDTVQGGYDRTSFTISGTN